VSAAPAPRYRWTILAFGVAAQAAFSAMTMGLPALGPALRDAFGLSLAQVGLVLASVNWGSVATLIARGALADRIGERTVIAAGLGSGAVALWAASLTDGFAGLLIALAVAGGLARLAAGRWSDRRGRRVAPLRRLAGLTVAGLLAVAALAQAPLLVLGPVLLGCGIVAMSWNGLSLTATAEIAGRARAGTAMGLQGTIMRLPAAAVGVAFGALVVSTSWALAFAALAALPLAGWALLAPLAPEEERRIAAREALRAKVPSSSPHERAVTA